MKILYIISALTCAGIAACDAPTALLNNIKTYTKKYMPITVPVGACLYIGGKCAACCPDPGTDFYSHADLSSVIAHNLDVAMDPYVDACAQWGPIAGKTLLVPLMLYGLSESTLRVLEYWNSCRGNAHTKAK